jgi:acetolactate synthase-1/2/3 large subunit
LTSSATQARVIPLDRTVASVVAGTLAELGVRHAFGVSGGGIGPTWRALIDEPGIRTLHFRHEAGAAFAAVEASLELDGPVAVFCTTGPGLTNSLTGLAAARSEGAKVVLLSPRTSPSQRGRGAVQETPMPSADLFSPGWLFDDVFALESDEELPGVAARLRNGFAGAGAYVAHLSVPISLQGYRTRHIPERSEGFRMTQPEAGSATIDEVAGLMVRYRFAVWVGHGARHAARQVRALVDMTGAPVLATPRGKGVVAENHPQFVMVTGLGGHPEMVGELLDYDPEFTLVLGSRLGEPSSGWDQRLVPAGGFVHVDINPAVPGTVFDAPVLAVHAEVGTFVDSLIARAASIPHRPFRSGGRPACRALAGRPAVLGEEGVSPQSLMNRVQRSVVDAGVPVLVEPGSAMAWASNLLVMRNPGQLRIVGGFGSMGQMACGVLGTAVAGRRPALCLTGDGSLLMNNEISTAVEYGIPAIWVVLNNGRYQMCEQGMRFGADERHARFPACDFAAIARAMGAGSATVGNENDLEGALQQALSHGGPFLVDVKVDPDAPAPFASRFETLSR